MQLRFSPSDRARKLLLLHQVPRSLLSDFTLDIKRATVPLEIGKRVVTNRQQARWFRRLYREHSLAPQLIICSSQEYYLTARRAGLLLFTQYLIASVNYPKTYASSRPLWHTTDLQFRNRLIEQYEAGQHQQPNLLVLDNLHADMGAVKRDKIHDILQVFCDRPRLLLLHSRTPFDFCRQQFGIRPNQIIHFDRQLQRSLV